MRLALADSFQAVGHRKVGPDIGSRQIPRDDPDPLMIADLSGGQEHPQRPSKTIGYRVKRCVRVALCPSDPSSGYTGTILVGLLASLSGKAG